MMLKYDKNVRSIKPSTDITRLDETDILPTKRQVNKVVLYFTLIVIFYLFSKCVSFPYVHDNACVWHMFYWCNILDIWDWNPALVAYSCKLGLQTCCCIYRRWLRLLYVNYFCLTHIKIILIFIFYLLIFTISLCAIYTKN